MRHMLVGFSLLALASLALGQTNVSSTPASEDSSDVVAKALGRATSAVLSDKTKPEDIDGILSDLDAALTYARANRETDSGSSYEELQGAQQFMRQWQAYLMDRASGNGRAPNDLQNLSNSERGGFAPIPRSQLLQRAMTETSTPSAAGTNLPLESLDDVAPDLEKLENMQRFGFSPGLNNLQNALQNLNMAYQSYLNKQYTQALQQLNNNYPAIQLGPRASEGAPSDLGKKVATLKDLLEMKIFSATLDLPNEPSLTPGQTAIDFLTGLAAERAKAGDWKGLQQVLETYQVTAGYQPQSWLMEDLSGIRCLLLGDKLEAAGQHLDAIRSYRQSLDTLGKYFPAEPAKQKLDAMAKAYPDEYKQALQLPIAPKVP